MIPSKDWEIKGGRLYIPDDDDRYEPRIVEALPPSRWDALRILFGRYTPRLRILPQRFSVKGIASLVKPELQDTNVAEQTHASTRNFLDRYES